MGEEFSITDFLLDSAINVIGELIGGSLAEIGLGILSKKASEFFKQRKTYKLFLKNDDGFNTAIKDFFKKINIEINERHAKDKTQKKVGSAKKRTKIFLSEFCLYSGLSESGIKKELSVYKTFRDLTDGDVKQAIVDVLLAMRIHYSESNLSEDNSALLALLCSDEVSGGLSKKIAAEVINELGGQISLISGGEPTFANGCQVVVRGLALTELKCPNCGKGILKELRSSQDKMFECSFCHKQFAVDDFTEDFKTLISEKMDIATDYLVVISNDIMEVKKELKTQSDKIDELPSKIVEEVFSRVQNLLEEKLLNSAELENKLKNSHNEIIEKLEKYINKILDNAEQNKKEVIKKVDESKLETITHINSSTDWLSKTNWFNSIFPVLLPEAISKFNGYFSRCKNCEDKDECNFFYNSDYYKIWKEYEDFRRYDYSEYDNADKEIKEQICNIFNKAEKCIYELNDIAIHNTAACLKEQQPENKREESLKPSEIVVEPPEISKPIPIGADCVVVCDCGAYVFVNKNNTEIVDGYITRTVKEADNSSSNDVIKITNIFNGEDKLLCPFCGEPVSPQARLLCKDGNVSVKDYNKEELLVPDDFYATFNLCEKNFGYKVILKEQSKKKRFFIVGDNITEIHKTYFSEDYLNLKIVFMGTMKSLTGVSRDDHPFCGVCDLVEFYNDQNHKEQESEIFGKFTLSFQRSCLKSAKFKCKITDIGEK